MAFSTLDGKLYDPRFKIPSSSLIIGNSGSGKTYYLRKMFTEFKQVYPQTHIMGCILIARQVSELGTLMREQLSPNLHVFGRGVSPTKDFLDSLPEKNSNPNKLWIIVFEDLMHCTDSDLDLFLQLTTFYTNHRNLLTFATTQSYFFTSDKRFITARRNCTYVIIIKPLDDDTNLAHINKTAAPSHNLAYFAANVKQRAKLVSGGSFAIMIDRSSGPASSNILHFRVRTPPFSVPMLVMHNNEQMFGL